MEKDLIERINPDYYNRGEISCIDAMISAYGEYSVTEFCKINAFKYLWRLGGKDDETQEIGKIKWYLDKYLELKAKTTPLPPVEFDDSVVDVIMEERESNATQGTLLPEINDTLVASDEEIKALEAKLKSQGCTQREIDIILGR